MTEAFEVHESDLQEMVHASSIANVQLFAVIDGEMVELAVTDANGNFDLRSQLFGNRASALAKVQQVLERRAGRTGGEIPVAAGHVKLIDALLGQLDDDTTSHHVRSNN